MQYVALGKTGILVSSAAFGAMSLDCKEIEEAGDNAMEKVCVLVRLAYDGGINFFDTSHSSPESERRLGAAIHGIRDKVILATKSAAGSKQDLMVDFKESLDNLCTDTIDLLQIENSFFVPEPKGKDGLYNAMLSLKHKGSIRYIGYATKDLELARKAIESGLYDTVQFPFNMIYPEYAADLVKLCADKDVGCIAMQPLNGGALRNIPLAVGFFSIYENAVPVWGFREEEEIKQILYFTDNPPVIDEKFQEDIKTIRDIYN